MDTDKIFTFGHETRESFGSAAPRGEAYLYFSQQRLERAQELEVRGLASTDHHVQIAKVKDAEGNDKEVFYNLHLRSPHSEFKAGDAVEVWKGKEADMQWLKAAPASQYSSARPVVVKGPETKPQWVIPKLK